MFLLMNTCGAEGIVALASGDAVLEEVRLPLRGTSEGLMPAVRRVLGSVRVGELDGGGGGGGAGVVYGGAGGFGGGQRFV